MRFYIVALLATSIFRVCNGLSFERPVSAPLESVGFQDESDSLANDGVFEFGPYDDLSHLISASGDQENPFSTGNEVADCGSNAKKNGKTRKGGGGSCPVVYDVQEVQVEECTPAKKLCPTFLEPLCCTGSKRNNGYPFAFDVGSCISCMYNFILFHRPP